MQEYDKKNNDTYVEKLSNNMVSDVEFHMFRNNKGSVVSGPGIRGDFSVESQLIAANNVLHFEKGSKLKIQSVKHKNLNSLVPLSLMRRYNKKPNDNIYSQKTPIFFNQVTEKFNTVLDNRFLRDLKDYPQFKESLKELINNNSIYIEKTEEEHIVLNYDSLNDLYNDTNKIFSSLRNIYTHTLLDIYDTQDVIIIAVLLDKNNKSYFGKINTYGNYAEFIKSHVLENHNIQFEFVKARQIAENEFYLYNKEGKLDISQSQHFNKYKNNSEKEKNAALEAKSNINIFGAEPDLLIMPYSDYDFNVLLNLKQAIDDIFKDLNNLLIKNKSIENMDKSLVNIDISNTLMLTNNSTSKKISP